MPRAKKNPEPPSVILPSPAANGALGEVLTLAEAAGYLRLPEEDVLRMIHEQGLPARQVGAEWRFLKAAIQLWLSTGLPHSSKGALLALVGKYRNDSDLMRICEEAYQRRGRPMTEDD